MQSDITLKKAKQNKKRTKQEIILFPCHEVSCAENFQIFALCFLKFMFRYEDNQFTHTCNAGLVYGLSV